MTESPIVHGLWIGNHLSPMELLTISSFTNCGHRFNLWTYEEIGNLPPGTIIRDAETIVPRREVFRYQYPNKFGHGKGSYAGFSDIFRYKLLYEFGGIWTDMDMTCIDTLPFISPYQFRHHKKTGIVGNYIQCPAKSDLMLWCYQEACASMHAESTDWMLPIRILNQGIRKFDLNEFVLEETNDDSFPEVAQLLKPGARLSNEWTLMHWMNEEFRRLRIPKDVCLSGSAYHQICRKHEVPITELSGKQAALYSWKISRANYLKVNLAARASWFLGKAAGRA